MVQLFSISSSDYVQEKHVIIPQVQLLLDEFSHLFAEPTSLPPWRDCGIILFRLFRGRSRSPFGSIDIH
jgi:hypothetical protein